MDVCQVDPIQDPRWQDLLARDPRASVFHSVNWLEALRLTYGYEPLAFTTACSGSAVKNGAVFCLVRSWITGRRLVSLPFSDHCEPLFDSPEELAFLLEYLRLRLHSEKWKYVEVRPVSDVFGEATKGVGFRSSRRYLLHRIDLLPEADQLFQSFDKDSIQRRIRRAERSGLVEKCGRDEDLLRDFYDLLVITRSRHHVPPQPYVWFQNLAKCFGGALEIRLAYKEQTPIAAILTLRFRDTAYYKYGCSNKAFNNLGATPLLLWRAISSAKSTAAKEFDLGRTDEDNAGLLAFKDKWNARSQALVYARFPASPLAVNKEEWKLKMLKRVFARLPDRVLAATGNLIYRHIG
jgi:hypothetical protein